MYVIENEQAFKKANEKKADILVSSAILGFALTRHYQNQPCQIDYEYPNKNDSHTWSELLKQKDKVSNAEVILKLLKNASLKIYKNNQKIEREKMRGEIEKITEKQEEEIKEIIKDKQKTNTKEDINTKEKITKKEKEREKGEIIKRFVEIENLKETSSLIEIIDNSTKQLTEEDNIDYIFIKKALEKFNKEKGQKEAEEELKNLMKKALEKWAVTKNLSKNEYDALLSYAHNKKEERLKDILIYCAYIKEIDDQQNHLNILSTISHVMDCYEPGSGKILDGQSPLGEEGKLITGKKGGEGLAFKERHGRMSISKAQMLEDAFNKKDGIYRGRGAYTGMIDNPLKDNKEVYPTERVAYESEDLYFIGEVYVNKNKDTLTYPKDFNNGVENKIPSPPWGMISPSNDKFINTSMEKDKGMGPLECDTKENRVGYVHGMCTAIVKCKHLGPWSTPYEMATGSATTKMASCFACTTYMYANGYPPSSIHLGRGESWVPPKKDYNRLEGKDTKSKDLDYSDNCLKEWQREIGNYVSLGLDCIKKAKAMNLIDSKHKELVKEIEEKIKEEIKQKTGNTKWTPMDEVKNTEDQKVVSEFFLEALTVHKKDSDRIKEVFNPLYQKYLTLSKHSFT